MARARKLFPIYGSALANNTLVALNRGRVVQGFVASYVAEYERRGILGGASREMEFSETIGREVVLAILIEVRSALPKFFGKKLTPRLKEDEKQAIDAFFREMIAAFDRAWEFNGEDRRQFRRDLKLYSDFDLGQTAPANTRKRLNKSEEEPPFVGRVALLLDPSMLEQARRASRKFHSEVARLAQKLLKQTLRPGR